MARTPGPWRFDNKPYSPAIVDSAGCRRIANMALNMMGDVASVEDAQLIAAAPEMLDALKVFHKMTAAYNEDAVWRKDVASIIAKAEGLL